MYRRFAVLALLLAGCSALEDYEHTTVVPIRYSSPPRLPGDPRSEHLGISGLAVFPPVVVDLFGLEVVPPRSLVVLLPGGLRPADQLASLARALASKNRVVVVPDLRGVGGSDGRSEFARGEVDDALAAIEHGVLTYFPEDRASVDVQIVGLSHGAMVALMAGFRGAEPRIPGPRRWSLERIVAYAPAADLGRWYGELRAGLAEAGEPLYDPKADNIEAWLAAHAPRPAFSTQTLLALEAVRGFAREWCGGPPDEEPEAYRERSPLFAIRRDEASKVGYPPRSSGFRVSLIRGERDELIGPEHCEELRRSLNLQLKGRVSFTEVKGLEHSPGSSEQRADLLAAIDRALNAVVGRP